MSFVETNYDILDPLRLQKESLEAELAARQKDYQDVFRKYKREQNPANKNSWKDQVDEILEDIDQLVLAEQDQEDHYEELKHDQDVDLDMIP